MAFRQKKDAVLRRKRFRELVAANAELIRRAGVPGPSLESEAAWLYLLEHRCSSESPPLFVVARLSDDASRAFVELRHVWHALG